ncbi:MAG: formate dehydrogenase accessory sulfurtransferase FdhD, partial [Rhodobacteraceae bacterium]|nr:formate dehydrogenase accessory sulfurtransferase FdhD [Paracoccaceae bacterium]
TQAVMMATPADLEDFAVGFSLSEQVIKTPADIHSLDVIETKLGIELRMDLATPNAERLAQRRRAMAGPVGCGLCGIESLKEAMRPVPRVDADFRVSQRDIMGAVTAIERAQALNRETRAVHAAAFWRAGHELVFVREDVGRHNALDKTSGAIARAGMSARDGVVVISSRVSIEMVQKAAIMGAPILIAVSAPTALAVRAAEESGITLAAVARDDGFEVFSHPDRIEFDARQNVA